jgi:hypothetical protein
MKITVTHNQPKGDAPEVVVTLGDPDRPHSITASFSYGEDGEYHDARKAAAAAQTYAEGAAAALEAFANQHTPRLDGVGAAAIEIAKIAHENG